MASIRFGIQVEKISVMNEELCNKFGSIRLKKYAIWMVVR